MASIVRLKVFLVLCVLLIGLNVWLTCCGFRDAAGCVCADDCAIHHCPP